MELLCRGKTVNGGKWRYGYACRTFGGTGVIFDTNTGISHDVIWKTVGLYIELNDCRKEKIFDGDIVQSITPGVRFIGVVEYKNGGFRVSANQGRDIFCFNYDNYHDSFRRLGNIHDNPELLQ